ncbi:type II toxin-antitoxin system HicA family toxin [Curtobacterium sp. MCBD17_003]|uniref:type II toxin-antitoxin system HicA family toxin n=1 Tax=Curtobacterium sp. MCBD17_003 TaxID=2175667 RepID=UPI0032E802F1
MTTWTSSTPRTRPSPRCWRRSRRSARQPDAGGAIRFLTSEVSAAAVHTAVECDVSASATAVDSLVPKPQKDRDVARFLREHGWVIARQGKGSHEVWRNPAGSVILLPRLGPTGRGGPWNSRS